MEDLLEPVFKFVFWTLAYLTSSLLLPVLSLGLLRVLPVGTSQTLGASWSFSRVSKFRIGVGPSLACAIGVVSWVLIGVAITIYVRS